MSINTRSIVDRLTTIESIAVIPRVASTNLVARRIVNECIENELSLPKAIIIAGEQFAGRGRNARQWSSPAGKGIYATTLLPLPVDKLPLVPLAIANIVASYLRDVFGLDARIKWPNDILVGGKKIAGILIEARINEERAFLLIGTGINVEPVADDNRPNATAISLLANDFPGIDTATEAFIEHLDKRLGQPLDREAVLDEWRRYSIHQQGDRIHCVLGDRTIDGTWGGIDEHGRALLRNGNETIPISAGDLIVA
ncbi:MAG TPA: biotin--[acetyl-CoA-carboxylase] ligase [Thermoanaerobaculia bacterium]